MEFTNATFATNTHFHPFANHASYPMPSQSMAGSSVDAMNVDGPTFTMPGQATLESLGFDTFVPNIPSLVNGPTFTIPAGPIIPGVQNTQFSSFNDEPTFSTSAQVMDGSLWNMPFWEWPYEDLVAFHSYISLHHHPANANPSGSQSSVASHQSLTDPGTTHNPLEEPGVNDDPMAPAASPNTQTPVRTARKRSYLKEQQRFQNLQNDRYVTSFTPTDVDCAGCGKKIELRKFTRPMRPTKLTVSWVCPILCASHGPSTFCL